MLILIHRNGVLNFNLRVCVETHPLRTQEAEQLFLGSGDEAIFAFVYSRFMKPSPLTSFLDIIDIS